MRWVFRTRLIWICLCWLGLACTNLRGQGDRVLGRYISQQWSAEQGLSGGRISSLAQTPDGYLWVGTENGLLRFDGFSFQPLSNVQKPTPQSGMDLQVDHQGTLWVRTADARLLRVEGDHAVPMMSLAQGDQNVIAIAPAQPSGVLVSEIAQGVLRIGNQQRENFHLKGPSLVISLAQAKSGTIWLGTRGSGLYRRDGTELTYIPTGIADSKINSLLVADSERLWIGTDHGLSLFDGRSASVVKLTPIQKTLQVLAMAQDHEGQLWVGTSEGLLQLTDSGAQRVLHSGGAVTALLADREGDIWFGDGQTLQRLRETPLLSYELPASIAKSGVGAVATDSRGRVWIAPMEGGLYWMLDGFFHKVSDADLDRDIVYSIDCLGDDVWLGRQRGGLTQLHAQGKQFLAHTWTAQDGLAQNSIYAVKVLADKSVWAASLTNGVSHLVNGRFVHYDGHSLGSDSIAAIEQTTDGSVWFATPNGLMKFNAGTWQPFPTGPAFSSKEILSLCADQHNGLFVGTALGLAYLDGSRHEPVHLPAALPHDPVLGIAVSEQGTVWFSTTSQTFSMSVAALHSSTAFATSVRSYTRTDGLSNSAGVRRNRSLAADALGRVYLATAGGLAVARGLANENPVPALAHVESVIADGTSLPLSDEVHVPAGMRRVTLNFAGLDLRGPEQVRLRYRLDDFDRTWSESSPTRQATYTNLQPGKYHFRLLAQNSQGDWAQQESVLLVTVEPMVQQRLSFRLGVGALLLLLAVWIVHARTQFVISQVTIRADERLAERIRIARELHDTLLQGFISVLLYMHVAADQAEELSPMRSALNHILHLMQHVIEEARLAVQGLRSPEGDVTNLEDFFRDTEKDVQLDSQAEYRFQIHGEKRAIRPFICEDVSRIGKEAIRNASQHSSAEEIKVTLSYTRHALELRVEDDGVGMHPAMLSEGRPGHWGMLGMRERARHVGGRLEIASSVGKGSRVVLLIPARVAYLGNE